MASLFTPFFHRLSRLVSHIRENTALCRCRVMQTGSVATSLANHCQTVSLYYQWPAQLKTTHRIVSTVPAGVSIFRRYFPASYETHVCCRKPLKNKDVHNECDPFMYLRPGLNGVQG